MITWLSGQCKVAKLVVVATYFGQDISTISRSLNRIITEASCAWELVDVKQYLQDAIAQA